MNLSSLHVRFFLCRGLLTFCVCVCLCLALLSPVPGIDADGNGFIDDVHGWDFADGDADPSDDDGHGTHCAGVIGAAKNGRGVVGAFGGSSSVRIMALRFLSSEGGRTSDAILALNYAVSMGAVISSNSWG